MSVEREAVSRLLEWFRVHGRDFPWRRTRDPYAVLVAEKMLQRTRSEQVAPVYTRFLERYPDPATLAGAPPEEVEELLEPLGLRWRAKKIWELARAAVQLFGGRIPADRRALLALPGVGEYAASAVLCFAYGEDVPVIDSNVVRVVTRLYGLRPRGEARRNRTLIEAVNRLHAAVPPGKSREYNWALLDLGATVCLPRNPKCTLCSLRPLCAYACHRKAKNA